MGSGRRARSPLYNEILEEQSAPVVKAIKDDRNRVLEVLNDKPYKDAKHSGYMERFEELLEKGLSALD